MIEDFLTKDLTSANLADELNDLGKEGWLIVNCWPASSGKVTCVFRRPRMYFCVRTNRYEPARPLALLTLESALAHCLAEPKMKHAKNLKDVLNPAPDFHSISLAKLGCEFAATEDEVVIRLKEAGLKGSPKNPGTFAAFVNGYSLWIYRKSEAAAWVLYAKKTAPQSSQGTVPPRKKRKSPAASPSSPAAPSPAANAAPFSVDDAIALCLSTPPKKKGMDHGVLLAQAVKAQGSDSHAAFLAFREIGLPTADHTDIKKCYVERNGRHVALKEWKPGVWYLNVKSVPS